MSRRLVNRKGASVASSSSFSDATAFPDYEPPSCPLDDNARRALADLSKNRGIVIYQNHLKESVRIIGSAVGDLHERLREQRGRLEHARARREEKGTEKSEEEERLEKHVDQLETQVNSLTDKSEEVIRDLIDRQAELEDESTILAGLDAHIVPRPAEDADEEPSGISALDTLNSHRAQKEAEYRDLSRQQRYALNNDYVHFKKVWHDAMAGEDGPPLPDASRWFREDGQPVMRAEAEMDDNGSDDDIAVAREVLSINCPLTLQVMKEPYSNRKCKHTFEKSAMLTYLGFRGEKQCPQTGCSQMHSRATFDEDFYLDQAMVRRIRRTLQAQEEQQSEDDDEDDDDEEVAVRGQKAIPGRVPKQERV